MGHTVERRGFCAEEAVGESVNTEQSTASLSGTESRGDLPVCFRCGKCSLPVDSIRASSGFCVKEQESRMNI